MTAIVAEQTRGPLVENIFRGDVAVVDATGRVLCRVGDAGKVTFWRSSAKPIQAMPLVLSGAADAFGFGLQHLAIFSASHNGEVVHTETVLDALAKAGLATELLQCGAHAPFDRETTEALAAAGQEPGSIHNNCSGKHTGMLALAKHLGLPLENYLDPESELQRLIRANVADVTGLSFEEIAIGVDGCGVPVFGLPLRNMAYAFARLADPEAMPEGKAEAGRRFRDALLAHPYLVAGRKRICTEIMGLPGGRFVAKSGAEGVYCVGVLPHAVPKALRDAGAVGGLGIAVKIEDGNNNVRQQVTVEVMRQLELLTADDVAALGRYGTFLVKNHAGRVVGEVRTAFTVEAV
ncbi:MAG: asparaginase [Symbiobacteriaceae bacterium]|jgi:L-asparaginase II|nr:asparaginase [Symbiobacteriaceae bacterium]